AGERAPCGGHARALGAQSLHGGLEVGHSVHRGGELWRNRKRRRERHHRRWLPQLLYGATSDLQRRNPAAAQTHEHEGPRMAANYGGHLLPHARSQRRRTVVSALTIGRL